MALATLLALGVLAQSLAPTAFGAAEPAAGEQATEAQATAEQGHSEAAAPGTGEEEHGAVHFEGFGPARTGSFAWAATGESTFNIGYYIDPPVVLMLAMVTIASLCIHLFSYGYMAHDEYPAGHERQSRFFSFIALFTASMLGMLLADNLLLFFICWELMGLCSYLLIGFWYYKPSAYRAARKAFITTRIGDVGMMLGLFYLYTQAGSLTFGTGEGEIFNPAFLERIETQTAVLGISVATVIALLIFLGTVGKSAQFPLHVWLPDAMEGPTPVSALIHAATMVAAGVFLVARTYPIFTHSNALPVVAIIGSFTALFAALIAVAQFDIKRILAYSTLSQLGFMVAALGIGGWVAAFFHLLTHAFFKALLFLGSGSVIHGMEATVGHDPVKAQDIRNMGQLRRFMPVTFLTYVVGYLALAGFPFFSGFFSKDEILADAFNAGAGGSIIGWVVYGALTVAAFLTAFYMTRQVTVVFGGQFRGFQPRPNDPEQEYSEAVPIEAPGDMRPAQTPEVAGPAHGHDTGGGARTYAASMQAVSSPYATQSVAAIGRVNVYAAQTEHATGGVKVYDTHDEYAAGGVETRDTHDIHGTHDVHDQHHEAHEPHESPWSMTLPLIVLAIFAFGAGFFNWPFAELTGGGHWLSHFLQQGSAEFNLLTAGIATVLAILGIVVGYVIYRGAFRRSTELDPLEQMMPGVFRTLHNKFYVDEFYARTVGRLTDRFARGLGFFDKNVVDGTVNGVGAFSLFLARLNFILDDFGLNQTTDTAADVTAYVGDGLRQSSTGKIQDYGVFIFAGVAILGLIYLYAF
jgi:NADH-quinone oxidoreductase subunit L